MTFTIEVADVQVRLLEALADVYRNGNTTQTVVSYIVRDGLYMTAVGGAGDLAFMAAHPELGEILRAVVAYGPTPKGW